MNVIKAYKSLAFPCFPTFSDRNVIKGRPLPPTWPAAVAGRSAQVAEGRRGDQQRFQAAGVGRNVRKKIIYIYLSLSLSLVGGLEHEFYVSIYWE